MWRGGRDQAASVGAVGVDERDRGKAAVEELEDAAAAVSVLHRGGGDHHHQQQPERVGDQVALAPVHLLAGVVAAACGRDGVGAAERLRVDDRCRRRQRPLLAAAHLLAQRIVQPVQRPVVTPAGEVPVHRLPGGKSFGSIRHEPPARTW